MSSVPKLPEEFSQMIACEATLVTLDDLLLLDAAPRYVGFFKARKETCQMEAMQYRSMWASYLVRDQNRNVDSLREPFDIFALMDSGGEDFYF